MKLLAISVFYNPTEDSFENLAHYINDVDELLIWDNTPDEVSINNIRQTINRLYSEEISKKIKVIGLGENVGLSVAYNQGIEYGRKNGFSHIMTMDQDSKWISFSMFKKFAIEYFGKYTNAIIGPVVNETCDVEEIRHIPNIINSGALYPLSVVDVIGNYCERFLVDAVDVEFCFRAHRHQIPVLAIGGHGSLEQKFGNCEYFKFRGRDWYCTNYSPFRLYGILRNHALISRIYPEQSDNKYKLRNVYMKQYTIAILLKERNKIQKLWAMYKGLVLGYLTRKSLDRKYSKA